MKTTGRPKIKPLFILNGKKPSGRPSIDKETPHNQETYKSGCMVCGEELVYFEVDRKSTCYYCGRLLISNACCPNGHFVCDACHRADAVEIIQDVCLHSGETDIITLMQTIRSHPNFSIHGPEHHALIPAIILTALKNNGCPVSDVQILSAIERGQSIMGGACAFLGVCGAAIGVGIAVSLLLEANPYKGDQRQIAQQATQIALAEIASYNAPRCCQRDCWLALKKAAPLLQEYTGISLTVNQISCEQYSRNNECIHNLCPLWPSAQKTELPL